MADDDFKELRQSLNVDNEIQSTHTIFTVCSYDRKAAQSRYYTIGDRKQHYLLNDEIATNISECPHKGLKYCLLLYGFTDKFKLKGCDKLIKTKKFEY